MDVVSELLRRRGVLMSVRGERSGLFCFVPGGIGLPGCGRDEVRGPGKGFRMRDGRGGFTLVELVVVMVIVSVLASLVVPPGLAYIDQKREEQCRLCQKAVLAYYHTATVDLGSELTLEDYLSDFKGDNASLDVKIDDSSKEVYSETLKDPNSCIIYKNNLDAARKQKCPSGGVYEYNPSTKKLECTKHQPRQLITGR